MTCHSTLLIGVGNPYRGDDGVGPWVLRRIKAHAPQNIDVRIASGEGAGLIELWQDVEHAIVVDAVRSGAEAGKVFRFEAHRQEIPTHFFHYSTHAFSLAEAVALARALGQLPKQLTIYGIEGEDFRAGQGLTPRVRDAAERVMTLILRDIGYAKEASCTSLP